ncbi:MAG: 30S ribosomal protein S12 methylthiotransferase RimO [Elusimicrobiales bacterium]|nr:30S ribosomal protein S12 methylthiotransferase RimO [Elusimicrobiales bacterium]
MKIFIESLGCPKNLADSEEICGALKQAGHEIVFSEDEADAALINTCAFLQASRDEAEEEIIRLLKLKKAGRLKKVAAAGCLVQKYGADLLRRFPKLDSIIDIYSINNAATAFNRKGFLHAEYPDPDRIITAPQSKMRLTAKHSAYLKIADGCSNRCAYCLIPQLRGKFRSKSIEDSVQEAKGLSAAGAKEISIIAQDTTRYGEDLPVSGLGKPSLEKLITKLTKIKRVKWWRIMYAYPERITPELIDAMKNNDSVCHYLDMPLQHISDSVLKRMNRISTEKTICEKINALRKAMPDFAIRTNFIVGFPGETDKDFRRLIKFIREYRLDNVGVFEFSPEPGTPAYDMPSQIPPELKRERAEILIEEQSRMLRKINQEQTGREITVLLDGPCIGRTYADAPDIDGTVKLTKALPGKTGQFIKARIITAEGYYKLAEPVLK